MVTTGTGGTGIGMKASAAERGKFRVASIGKQLLNRATATPLRAAGSLRRCGVARDGGFDACRSAPCGPALQSVLRTRLQQCLLLVHRTQRSQRSGLLLLMLRSLHSK